MTYAIIEASGKQLWIEPGRFYDINYIAGEPGDTVIFNRVLLIKENDKIEIGQPCIESRKVKAKILKHIRGTKTIIFKMKQKKNKKTKQGHRQKLTRLLIQNINND